MIYSPKKKSRLRSNKKANQEKHTKTAIDDYHNCGIGPSKIAHLINVSSHSSSKILVDSSFLALNFVSAFCVIWIL